MEISFKIVVAAIVIIVAFVIALGIISLLGGKSDDLFAKLICPWC